MDVEQYKMFLAVANCGSISEAARQLNIAQPALSIKMKKMAEECGTDLFEKKKGVHRISLTAAGNLVYNKAQQICDLENELMTEVKDYNNGLRGILRISIFPWENEEMIYKAIKGFHELYPEVKFEIFPKKHYLDASDALECELAVMTQEELINYEKTRDIIISGSCPIYVAVAKNTDIISQKTTSIKMADLDNVPLIFPMDRQGRNFVSQMLHAHLRVNVVGYFHYRNGGLYMARAGLGAVIVTRNDDSKYYPDLHFLKLEDSQLKYRYVVAKKKGREISVLMRKFIEYRTQLNCDCDFTVSPKVYDLIK